MATYPTPAEVGLRLAKARVALGLTQAQAAMLAECETKTVARAENGHYYPKMVIMFRLCRIYGIDARDVVAAQE